MLAPIRNRYVALIGLAAMVPLAWSTVQGRVGLDVAATRAVILLLVLVAIDRALVPLVQLVFMEPSRGNPPPAIGPGPPTPTPEPGSAIAAEPAPPGQRRSSDAAEG